MGLLQDSGPHPRAGTPEADCHELKTHLPYTERPVPKGKTSKKNDTKPPGYGGGPVVHS